MSITAFPIHIGKDGNIINFTYHLISTLVFLQSYLLPCLIMSNFRITFVFRSFAHVYSINLFYAFYKLWFANYNENEHDGTIVPKFDCFFFLQGSL